MKDFQPLTDKEQQAIGKVVEELRKISNDSLYQLPLLCGGMSEKDPYPGYFWSSTTWAYSLE